MDRRPRYGIATVAAKPATALVCLAMILSLGAASAIPLPRPRPIEFAPSAARDPGEPSACQLRLAEIAIVRALPNISENGGCEADDVVRLEAVLPQDGKTRIALSQPAVLRCPMAEQIAHWVRHDLVPATRGLGKELRAIDNYDSYVCRTRNNVSRAKLSEHARANALDIHGLIFTDRSSAVLTDPAVSRDFREAIRASACARFKTVLGPGSDSYHETHVHLDLLDRKGGYRMCQWDIRDPAPEVPLPKPRPTMTSFRPGNNLQ